MKNRLRLRAILFAAIACMSTAAAVVHAGERDAMPADVPDAMPADVPDAYTQECASCHTAYPPGMLPAASWHRLMTALDRHYGTDASLDADATARIAAWLRSHAGTWKRVRDVPPEDRITRSAWFVRKHRDVDTAVWRHASVKSAANCEACHVGAERGQFDDDDLRVPVGLDARYRRAWND
jgi:uncharacterized membrane protein